MSVGDRLDSLTVLVHAMLSEIESLKENKENVVPIMISAELSRFEAGLIRSALLHTGGRQRQAARLLGMKVSTLHRKVKLYKLRSLSERPGHRI
jgi:DNA-binding NtrC family response regulator